MGKRKNVIAPNDEKSLVAMEKMAISIEKARELYGDGEPFDEERVLDCITFRADRASFEFEAMGKYCLWYRAEAGHGKFLEGLKRRNLDVRAAQWTMLMVEKFGTNTTPVSYLGVRKARCLTAFTREEIDIYAKGGPLRDIPHDDVANMTTRELEAEVRKLRKKVDEKTNSLEAVIKQKSTKIDELEKEIRYRGPPTKEQLAGAKLDEYSKPFNTQLHDAIFAMNCCIDMITEVQRIDSIGYAQLNDWVLKQSDSIAMITEAFTELQGAINDIHIDRVDEGEEEEKNA
jgi:hypothetical protein